MSIPTERQKAPLRKIVREFPKEVLPMYHLTYEELECGHEQRQPNDLYGPMNWQERRRCLQCGKLPDA